MAIRTINVVLLEGPQLRLFRILWWLFGQGLPLGEHGCDERSGSGYPQKEQLAKGLDGLEQNDGAPSCALASPLSGHLAEEFDIGNDL
jgi:hypothetical protein